jgi:predicted rRNA methylase YqxC with S4 and FtsJ domains
MQKKRRLDDVCCELAPEYSKNVIQSFILSGKVFVNDEKVTKAGHQVRKRGSNRLVVPYRAKYVTWALISR